MNDKLEVMLGRIDERTKSMNTKLEKHIDESAKRDVEQDERLRSLEDDALKVKTTAGVWAFIVSAAVSVASYLSRGA